MSTLSSITMIALEPLIVPACGERIEIVRQIEHVGLDQNFFALGVLFLELEFFARLQNFRGRTAGNDGF